MWMKPENHLKFFDQKEKLLNINKPEDWYQVTKQQIFSLGGTKMLQNYYNDSLHEVVAWQYSFYHKLQVNSLSHCHIAVPLLAWFHGCSLILHLMVFGR